MKINVKSGLNLIDVLRRAGYGQVSDQRATEASFSRRLGEGIYPRFHAYISGNIINLHLDQKQASYSGYSAHSGEYDGEAVEAETQRIIGVMEKMTTESRAFSDSETTLDKSGFWGKLFGG